MKTLTLPVRNAAKNEAPVPVNRAKTLRLQAVDVGRWRSNLDDQPTEAVRRSGPVLSWGGAAAAQDHTTTTSTDGDATTRLHLS